MAYAAPHLEPAVYLLHLRINVTQDGSWQITLGLRDTRPDGGTLDSAAVARLLAAVHSALDPADADPLLSEDSDLDQAAAERAAGQALSEVLNATPRLSGLFSFYLGKAEQAEQELVLAVDVSDPDLRALPWELLARDTRSGPLERARLTIARLGQGPSLLGPPLEVPPPRGTLQTLVWCPDPDEPLSASLLRVLERTTAAHHLPAPEDLEGAPQAPDAVVVLHLICHGQRYQDQLALLFGETARDIDGPLQRLLPRLRSVDLVVLSVCESGTALPSELAGLVGQLLSHGAPAVVAPAGSLSTEAVGAFLPDLYSAIVDGSSLTGAVGAGRRAVRALSLPYPDARWSRLQLTIASLKLPRSLLWQGWRPDGWPHPAPDCAQLLHRARQLAEPSGFVGVEHILLALAEQQVSGPMGLFSHQCRARSGRIHEHLAGWAPAPGAPSWAGTPRLQQLGGTLAAGFSLRALWELLEAHSWPLLSRLLKTKSHPQPTDDFATAADPELPLTHTAPVGLEIIGGPEDGRCIHPAPGELIGRWSQPARCQHPLYQNTRLWDRRLSRTHLRWEGAGTVRLLSSGILLRAGTSARHDGLLTLSVGDLLRLGEGTLFRVIGEVTP